MCLHPWIHVCSIYHITHTFSPYVYLLVSTHSRSVHVHGNSGGSTFERFVSTCTLGPCTRAYFVKQWVHA